MPVAALAPGRAEKGLACSSSGDEGECGCCCCCCCCCMLCTWGRAAAGMEEEEEEAGLPPLMGERAGGRFGSVVACVPEWDGEGTPSPAGTPEADR